jgi:poly(3-hydroxyalkanoate) synthetase
MDWVQKRSGAKAKAPAKLGAKGFAPGDPAPGQYVLEQA